MVCPVRCLRSMHKPMRATFCGVALAVAPPIFSDIGLCVLRATHERDLL